MYVVECTVLLLCVDRMLYMYVNTLRKVKFFVTIAVLSDGRAQQRGVRSVAQVCQ